MTAQNFADSETVDVGKHQIEKDQVRALVRNGIQCRATTRRGKDAVAGSGEVEMNQGGYIPFIINAKNS